MAIEAASIKADRMDMSQAFVGMTIQSSNYYSGYSGWKLSSDGTLELYSEISGKGDLAELDKVELAQLGSTLISGGYIKTELLETADIVVANDIVGTMHFTSTGKITFARSDQYVSGSSTTMALNSGANSIRMFNAGGVQINAEYSTSADIYLNAVDEIRLDAGSTDRTLFAFGGTNKIEVTNESNLGIGPLTTNTGLLGWDGKYWNECRATTFYDNGGGYLDTHDDLTLLAEFKPKMKKVKDPGSQKDVEVPDIDEKTGTQRIDILALPEWLIDKQAIREKLKRDNGDLITEADIDEWIEDYDEAGWMVGRNVSLFNDLTSGAVRQLDHEMIEMFELLSSRLTTLENQLGGHNGIAN
jgi:hypothetical protein